MESGLQDSRKKGVPLGQAREWLEELTYIHILCPLPPQFSRRQIGKIMS